MKKLSINEQKIIVGGYWCLKVYDRSTGGLVEKKYDNSPVVLQNYFEREYGYLFYNAVYVPIGENVIA